MSSTREHKQAQILLDYSIRIKPGEQVASWGTIAAEPLALGAGYPETGSLNKSAIDWDMFCDLWEDSEIRIDGELILKNGEILIG